MLILDQLLFLIEWFLDIDFPIFGRGLHEHVWNIESAVVGVEFAIRPKLGKNARIWKHSNTKTERLKRDENLRSIRKDGRKEWKKNSGYHLRSLAETTMFRLKTIFGNTLSARLLETQTTQALVRCAALNKMTHLGMPQSHKVA